MTFTKKCVPAIFVALLCLPGQSAHAQVVNCLLAGECVDPGDKPAASAERTLCREDALAGTYDGLEFTAGIFLNAQVVSQGGGPPFSLAGQEGCPDPDIRIPPGGCNISQGEEPYYCIGINLQPQSQ